MIDMLLMNLEYAMSHKLPCVTTYGKYGSIPIEVHVCDIDQANGRVQFSYDKSQDIVWIDLANITMFEIVPANRFIECCSADGSGYTDEIDYEILHKFHCFTVEYDGEKATYTDISEARACASFACQPHLGGFHSVTIMGSVDMPTDSTLYMSVGDWI